MAKQIHLNLSPKAAKQLDELQQQMGLSTTETIRSSIALARLLEAEKRQGNDVILKHQKTGKERIIVMVK